MWEKNIDEKVKIKNVRIQNKKKFSYGTYTNFNCR